MGTGRQAPRVRAKKQPRNWIYWMAAPPSITDKRLRRR
jgi:hypothetical protein